MNAYDKIVQITLSKSEVWGAHCLTESGRMFAWNRIDQEWNERPYPPGCDPNPHVEYPK